MAAERNQTAIPNFRTTVESIFRTRVPTANENLRSTMLLYTIAFLENIVVDVLKNMEVNWMDGCVTLLLLVMFSAHYYIKIRKFKRELTSRLLQELGCCHSETCMEIKQRAVTSFVESTMHFYPVIKQKSHAVFETALTNFVAGYGYLCGHPITEEEV